MTTYCAPGPTYKCVQCGTVRTRPEYLLDAKCREIEWCATQRLLQLARDDYERRTAWPEAPEGYSVVRTADTTTIVVSEELWPALETVAKAVLKPRRRRRSRTK
jgi:hypothetical protein